MAACSFPEFSAAHYSSPECAAVCCSIPECAAAYCSFPECAAVYCSFPECAAGYSCSPECAAVSSSFLQCSPRPQVAQLPSQCAPGSCPSLSSFPECSFLLLLVAPWHMTLLYYSVLNDDR